MVRASHTPGPWRVELERDGFGPNILSPEGLHIADLAGPWKLGAQRDANAQLIVAAPTLLATLKNLRGHLSRMDDSQALVEIADKAIQEAVGE